MLQTLIMFLFGIGVGTLGSIVGIGGGIFIVPVFLLILHYPPQAAAGTSLAIVFFNALSATIAFMRQNLIYYDAAIRFSLAALPGAVLGSIMSRYFTGPFFSVAFGALLLLLALFLALRPHDKAKPALGQVPGDYNRLTGTSLSTLVGFFSSIFGVGGGVIHVPAMIGILGFPVHVATATSQFILAFSSLCGLISHFVLGNVLPLPALAVGSGAVLGAQIGARLAPKLKSHTVTQLLCAVLFVLGLRMIIKL